MNLIRSRKRVADHGEVFTPAWMVEAMLDLVEGRDGTDRRPFPGTGVRQRQLPRAGAATQAGGSGTEVREIRLQRAALSAPGFDVLIRDRTSGRQHPRVPREHA